METERLIRCVRRHEFLYNIRHWDYKNISLKAAVWESIGRELNQNADVVRIKWKTIRDGYKKYKKMLAHGKKVSEYLWSPRLSFLDNYSYRATKGQVRPSSPMETTQVTPDSDQCEETSPVPSSPGSMASSPLPETITPDLPDNSNPSTSRSYRQVESKCSCDRHAPYSVDKVLEYLKTKHKKKDVDGTDHLFLSYAECFKKFPLREQAALKLEMAKLFANTEMRLIQQRK